MLTKQLMKRLSPALVEGAKPEAKPYRIWDTVVPQLFLRVQPSGVRSWNVKWKADRAQFPNIIHGQTNKSLGKWPGLTVDSARTIARNVLIEVETHGAPLDVIEASRPPSAEPTTFGEFIRDSYAPWAKANQKSGQATIEGIAATFATLYEKPLADVSAFDIERIKAQRLNSGRKPSTVNRDLDRIRGALSRAVDWELIDKHPLRTVKRAKGADNSRVRYLSKAEANRLREALQAREEVRRQERASANLWRTERGQEPYPVWPKSGYTDHLMPMVLLALNTGLRRGELFSLDWKSVNLAGKLLTVEAGNAKSRKARHLPLNIEALGVLKRWSKQGSGEGLVFPNASGERFGNINKSWAGITDDAKLIDFRFHDLRHDFASKLVMAGVDLNTVRELLGHADIAMTLRYAHLAPEHKAAAVALLGGGK